MSTSSGTPASPGVPETPVAAEPADRSEAAATETPPDSSGGPGDAAGPDGGGDDGDGIPGDAPPPRRRRRRRILAGVAGALALVLVAGAGTAWWAYHKLNGNIHTDTRTGEILRREDSERPARNPDPKTYNAENILLIGSDDRSGANAAYGSSGGQRSDTTILLHLSADRKRAVAVSIPRDLMVQVPACERADGSRTRAQHVQFNWAFEFAGAACTIRTVENMTGIRIDHHMIVDFTGFKKMVDAVGGVDVCLPQAVHDRDAKLDLSAGRHTLNGEQALGFVRVRETLGDGSDTERMGRQQEFLASLVKKVQSEGVLLDPTELWPLLNAATSAITADRGLSTLSDLYDLVESLRSMQAGNVVFLTAPREPYPADPNRDQLVQPAADMLFQALDQDRQVRVVPQGEDGTAPSAGPSRSPAKGQDKGQDKQTPSFSGRTANQDICGGQ